MISTDPPSRRWRCGLIWAAVAAAGTPVARSDQVVTAEASYPKVAVIGYADGDLHLRLPDGGTRAVSLTDASGLVIDTVSGMADFNQAERYFEQHRLQEAGVRYERALRLASGYWAFIIHHRLVQVYDGLGKLERAVAYFVKVADDSPAAAARLMPANIPSRPNAAVRRALRRLTSEAKKSDAVDRRVLMELAAYAVMLQTDAATLDQHTRSVARTDIPASIATEGVCAVKIAALERLLADGAYGRVLIAADAMMARCPGGVLPDLFLLQGRALLARDAGREELLRAGLAFMRMAIHFPDHDRAPEALYGAARVHQRLQRPRKALQLLDECLAHKRISQPIRDQARAQRERLTAGLAD